MKAIIIFIFSLFIGSKAFSGIPIDKALVKTEAPYHLLVVGSIEYESNYVQFVQGIFKALKSGASEVNIYINSPGGNVYETMLMIGHMRLFQTFGVVFNCFAIQAQSAAFSLFQSCNNRYAFSQSILMSHRGHNSDGSPYDHDNYRSDVLRLGLEAIRIGYSFEFWYKMVEDDFYVRGDQCRAMNVCDKILPITLIKKL